MKTVCIVGIVGMFGMMGCATTGSAAGAADARGLTMTQPEGVRAGEARVVAEQINPRVPVHVTAQGESLAVRFAHPHAAGALVHLSAASLAPVSPEEQVEADRPAAPDMGVSRVVFRDGRFVVCSRRGSAERGYQLVAQAWTAAGSRLGQPVVVSPTDSDVFGAAEIVAIDSEHAVATFAAMSGDRFELLAVRLEVL